MQMKSKLKGMLASLVLLSLSLCHVNSPAAAATMEHPFALSARAAVLMDFNSGQFVYGQNPNLRIKPASFVKVLTLFLVFDAIKRGEVRLDDPIPISTKAWKTGGSKMFVRQGDRIPLRKLIKGIAVVSGNDACVAVAEYLQGSTEAFVDRMQEKIRSLGLENTSFQTVNGWPAPDQYTTAADMARLARAYIQAHPEALAYHQIKELTHENIRQRNRNGLLWRDPSVDGLKTGHTEEAGYHLLATARRGDQRFIAVVMGAKSEAVREREALRLLNYGFRNFASVELFQQGEVLAQVPVWKGTKGEVDLVTAQPGVVTVPIAEREQVAWKAEMPQRLFAPINRQEPVGRVVITSKGREVASIPLHAREEIPRAGLFKRAVHSAILFVIDQGSSLAAVLVLAAAVVLTVFLAKKRRPRKKRRG